MSNGLASALLRLVQQRLLFRPVRLAPDYRFRFDAPFEELFFDTPDGERLNALFFPAATQPSRGVVLYFHGNRDNLQRWGALHSDFTRRGFDFLAPDYRGYGKSTGQPDEPAYFQDARLLYDWLAQRYDPADIILYGRSLGSAMASHLAATRPARMLILETPFDNFPNLAATYLRRPALPLTPWFRFPNDEHLRQTTLPVLILHGTRDRVVPLACARNLQACLKKDDRFIILEGGSHHNLPGFEQYQEALDEWLLLGPVKKT